MVEVHRKTGMRGEGSEGLEITPLSKDKLKYFIKYIQQLCIGIMALKEKFNINILYLDCMHLTLLR